MATSKLITNQGKLVEDVIKAHLPSTEEAKFLVGYFFFTGYRQIYQSLKDINTKILIWLGTDNIVKNEHAKSIKSKEITEADMVKQSMLKTINTTNMFDNQEWVDALESFASKLEDGSLQLKKTNDPNHAKVYLFNFKKEYSHDWEIKGAMVTGSSNLSYQWLKWQEEFNMSILDQGLIEEVDQYFDKLWDTWSFNLCVTETERKDMAKKIREQTWLKPVTPYECYVKLLHEYFNLTQEISTPESLTNGTIKDLNYQIDAIKKAIQIVNEHNGVIVADVVWLGKSIIGSCVVKNLQDKYEMGRCLIIAKPHLRPQWEWYKEQFDFRAEVKSSGNLQEAIRFMKDSVHKYDIIMIDEVHYFRNDDTLDYAMLHELCQGKKVILLSATPFNNEPEDVTSLIRLFQNPLQPTIHTRKGIFNELKELQKTREEVRKDKENIDHSKILIIADRLKKLVWPVTIRRSRIDLGDVEEYADDLKAQGFEINVSEDPIEQDYDLWSLTKLYKKTLDALDDIDNEKRKDKQFKCARYMLWNYIKKDSKEKYVKEIEKWLWYSIGLVEGRLENLPRFIKRHLVSRFESSIQSFKNTLNNNISSYDALLAHQKNGYVPLVKKGGIPSPDEVENDKIDQTDYIKIYIEDIDPEFFEHMNEDVEFLNKLKEERGKVYDDPKFDQLEETVQSLFNENKKRKIVIYSQYKDTVDYLKEKFNNDRVLVVTWGTKTKQVVESIAANFDAWLAVSKQEDNYDILLCTDAVSEWYNLHRAGIIINYDIPYNPTVVVQRVWRINRINKKVFDNIYIYNFFPSEIGEAITRTRAISTMKMKIIAAVFGVDTKTLTSEEETSSFYTDRLKAELKSASDVRSWDTKYLDEYKKIKASNPEIIKKIEELPQRIKIMRVKQTDKWTLMFAKRGKNFWFLWYDITDAENPLKDIEISDAFDRIKADEKEKGKVVDKEFFEYYQKLQDGLHQMNMINSLNRREEGIIKEIEKRNSIVKNVRAAQILQLMKKWLVTKFYYTETNRLKKMTDNNQYIQSMLSLFSLNYIENLEEEMNRKIEADYDLIITQQFI